MIFGNAYLNDIAADRIAGECDPKLLGAVNWRTAIEPRRARARLTMRARCG